MMSSRSTPAGRGRVKDGRRHRHERPLTATGTRGGSDDGRSNNRSETEAACNDSGSSSNFSDDDDWVDEGMFGSSVFENDPFFSQHREQMRRMDQMFQAPFMSLGGPSPGLLGLEDGRRNNRHRQQQQQQQQNMQISNRNQQMMDPFAHFNSMFSNMRSMMSDMHQAFQQGASQPNGHVYQQSSFYSSSNVGGGAPKVYQASSSVRQIPGGVKETRKTVRDSEAGVERVAMGHHINDRAHIIERSRNTHTGETNENQELINLDEEEAPAFDSEYQDRWRSTMRGVEQRRRRIREHISHHRPVGQSTRALPEPEANSSSRRPRKTSHRKE